MMNLLHEVFEKVLYSVYYQTRDEKQNAPLIFRITRKDKIMEKEMFVLAKFKSGDGTFEKFMGWMQSDEGMSVRKSVAHVEKTVPAVAPDKSYIMFKLSVHNEEGLKELASGTNVIAKPIFDECIESIQVWECNPLEI